jgi:multidrug efflux pump subunit AcrB
MWTVHHDALVAGKYLALKEYVNAERAIVRRTGGDIRMWIVQLALRRPYTFIVLAVLIAIFGSRSALRTPTDIFPSINIPVVSVVWTYSGLLPKDMSDRVIYYYERELTSQVNGIQHMESQSLNGYGVVKIFFQKGIDIGSALAQVTAGSQTVLKLLPAGITPPYVLSYNASSVPILNLVLSSKKLPQDQLFDLGQNFIRPQLATVNGAALPSPYGGKILQAQVDLDQRAMQSHNVSAEDVVNAISAQNLVLPAGTEKIGKFEWNVDLNASPTLLDHINDLPVKKVDGTVIHIRDVAYAHDGAPPQTNVVRVNGARAVLILPPDGGPRWPLDQRPDPRELSLYECISCKRSCEPIPDSGNSISSGSVVETLRSLFPHYPLQTVQSCGDLGGA